MKIITYKIQQHWPQNLETKHTISAILLHRFRTSYCTAANSKPKMFLVKSLMITNTDNDQINSRKTVYCIQNLLTHAHILRFLRIFLAGTLELRFASFSRQRLETMFCLIWSRLVTLDFTYRIFKNLLTLSSCLFYGLLCKQAKSNINYIK